uniref:dTDP-4-dehydrorhamnose reductase n=1 Tax=uncultured Prochlorococcus sp. TaxID=159733 RepID=UPI00338FE05B
GSYIIETKPKNINLIHTTKKDLDLSKTYLCKNLILSEKPDWVINCAAFTAVDQAEKDIELSNKINSYAPEAFANALNITKGKLLHISTDFVFNGEQNYPYETGQKRNPINQYGASKSLGEELIQKENKGLHNSKILRTSWVISPYGRNFVLTMLKLHSEKETINVVYDQIGVPTSAKHLAKTCWKIVNYKNTKTLPQILHWSDSGVASWYDLAVAIGEIGLELGIINKIAKINPIKTKNYPTPAKRPKYSILDTTTTSDFLKVEPNHWRINLMEILLDYKKRQDI